MTIEEIKYLLKGPGYITERLILTWIEAEARARKAEFWLNHPQYCLGCAHHEKTAAGYNWIAAVKAEVGWPEDR